MADTCRAPSGQQPFSFGLKPQTLAFVVVPILALAPLMVLIVLPFTLQLAGRVMGWYLRKKTDGRRAHLLELMAGDEKQFRQKNTAGKDGTDDDWETIESHTVGSAGNGETGKKEWDGVIGFFHPFW